MTERGGTNWLFIAGIAMIIAAAAVYGLLTLFGVSFAIGEASGETGAPLLAILALPGAVVAPEAKKEAGPGPQEHHRTSFALRGVSFALRAGKLHGIVGPVGSGKSTMLRAILGDLEAEEIRTNKWTPAPPRIKNNESGNNAAAQILQHTS